MTWSCPACLVHLPDPFGFCPHCGRGRREAPAASPRKVGEVRRPVGLTRSLRTSPPPWLGLCPGPAGRFFWRAEDGKVALCDLEGNEEASFSGVEASDLLWTGSRLLVVDRPGQRILSWDGSLVPLAGLPRPYGLAAGPRGEVLVSCDAELVVLSAEGRVLSRFGQDVPHRTFTAPANRGVAWSDGLIWCADEAFGLVKAFREDGTLARFLGGPPFERLRHTVMGYLDEERYHGFRSPRGLAVDGEGRLFVGEAGQDAVLIYSPVDRLLGRCTVSSPGGLYSDGKVLRVASGGASSVVSFLL